MTVSLLGLWMAVGDRGDIVDVVTKPIRAAGVNVLLGQWLARFAGSWVAGGEWVESLWCVWLRVSSVINQIEKYKCKKV